MSSHYNATFNLASFYTVLKDEEGEFLDCLNPRVIKYIRSIRSYTPHVWSRNQKIEHVAYEYHGTTTSWKIILLYNGIISPFSIKPGQTIKVPSLSELTSVISYLGRQRSKDIAKVVNSNLGSNNTYTSASIGEKVTI